MRKNFIVFFLFLFFCLTVLFLPEVRLNSFDQDEQRFAGSIQYLHQIKSNQRTGRVDLKDVYNAKQKVYERKRQRSSQSVLEWAEMGPNNVGGRTRAILIDKDQKWLNTQDFLSAIKSNFQAN